MDEKKTRTEKVKAMKTDDDGNDLKNIIQKNKLQGKVIKNIIEKFNLKTDSEEGQ
jgi:hypothetical protein